MGGKTEFLVSNRHDGGDLVKMSHMTYDPQADAAYIPVAQPEQPLEGPNVLFPAEDNLIFDAQDGHLVGVEILAARDFLGVEDPGAVQVTIDEGDDGWVLTFSGGTDELATSTGGVESRVLTSQDRRWTADLECGQGGQLLRLTLRNRA